MADEEKPFDINDCTMIKEGEAEILMHVKNEVFYKKAQVNNRDMSIAVLRTSLANRKQEHEAELLLRKMKRGTKKVEKPVAHSEAVELDGKSNGYCDVSRDVSQDERCSILEDPAANQEKKAPVDLKPPQVLEALSASGLRDLRYAREVDGIGKVVALDNDKYLLNPAGEILNLMVRLHVRRWIQSLLMLESTCLHPLKNLMWLILILMAICFP